MINANDVTVFLGGKMILDGATFQVGDGERVAVVGPNGAGKSTLLKAIAEKVPVESGDLTTPKDQRVGYLPQIAAVKQTRTVREELRSVFAEALSALDEMADLEHRMGEVDHESDEFRQIGRRYDFLLAQVNRLDAYNLDSQIGQISAGLGFAAEDLDRPCGEFSGGWQMRVELAKVLLSHPDVFLLDEPTNHLDLETIEWLEDWLLSLNASVVFVSHERSFMDNLAQRIFEIDRGRLTIFKGNYARYLEERVERRENQRRAYENQQREIERAEDFIRRFRYQANKAAGVQSRIKTLDKLERLQPPPAEQATIHFNFPQPPRSGKEVIKLDGVGHRYGDLTVLSGVDQVVYRGERVALVGVNGAGKSTLMKIMAGVMAPTDGTVEIGTKVEAQYFAQYEHDTLHPSWTVEAALAAIAPIGEAQRARDVAGAFLFTGDDVEKPVNVLSGGERTRLRLAMMLFSPANLLLLDEPTNHLDVGSRQTLETALQSYTGTVVMVSHDRVFMDKVVTRILEVRDGGVREFHGDYKTYLKKHHTEMGLAERPAPSAAPEASTTSTSSAPTPEEQSLLDAIQSVPRKLSREEHKSRRKQVAESRRERQNRLKPLRQRVKKLEGEIEKIEQRQSEVEQALADPTTYANPDRAAELGREQKALDARLHETMAAWEQAGEELTEAQD